MFYVVKIIDRANPTKALLEDTCNEGEQEQWNKKAKAIANKTRKRLRVEFHPRVASFDIDPDPEIDYSAEDR